MKDKEHNFILYLVFMGGVAILLINILRIFEVIATQDSILNILGLIMGVCLIIYSISTLRDKKKKFH